jgi:hypothetical protein
VPRDRPVPWAGQLLVEPKPNRLQCAAAWHLLESVHRVFKRDLWSITNLLPLYKYGTPLLSKKDMKEQNLEIVAAVQH